MKLLKHSFRSNVYTSILVKEDNKQSQFPYSVHSSGMGKGDKEVTNIKLCYEANKRTHRKKDGWEEVTHSIGQRRSLR